MQVAKAFWDLDDANNEAGTRAGVADDDTLSLTTSYIISRLNVFPDGTGNRMDRESDAHGVNMRDCSFHAGGREETLLEHNCLIAQDSN